MALKYLYVPSGYKSGTAYGVLPNDSTADFDNFVRNTIATRTNKDGLLEAKGSNIPRIDYSDGGCPSLLLERMRTNIAQYSEQINSWGKNPDTSSVIVRSEAEVSPDGNMTADVISVLTQYDGVYTQGITTIVESDYSCSAYVKHIAGSSKIRFGVTKYFYSTTPTNSTKYIIVDLSSGSIISNEVSSFAEAKVVDAGNGWYRLIIEGMTIPVGGGGNSNMVIYSYEDTFTEFAVWGGQIEVGDYTSSYIPNLSNGTTTRNNDRSGWAANFSGMNSNEGVLEARFKAVPADVSNRITLSTDINGNTNNRITIGYGVSGGVTKPYVSIVHEGTEPDRGYTVTMPSSFNIFDYNTYQFKFEAGNNQLKINGELVTIRSEISGLNFLLGKKLESVSLNFFGDSTSYVFYGGIQHIKVYDSITDF